MIHNLSRESISIPTDRHNSTVYETITMALESNEDQLHPAAAIFRTVGKEQLFY